VRGTVMTAWPWSRSSSHCPRHTMSGDVRTPRSNSPRRNRPWKSIVPCCHRPTPFHFTLQRTHKQKDEMSDEIVSDAVHQRTYFLAPGMGWYSPQYRSPVSATTSSQYGLFGDASSARALAASLSASDAQILAAASSFLACHQS